MCTYIICYSTVGKDMMTVTARCEMATASAALSSTCSRQDEHHDHGRTVTQTYIALYTVYAAPFSVFVWHTTVVYVFIAFMIGFMYIVYATTAAYH